MSSKYQVIKSTTLTGSPQANSIYYIKGASDSDVKVYVTDSAGTAFPIGIPNLILDREQSVKLVSSGVMITATNNTYQSVFDAGSNITSRVLRSFDVSNRTIYDVIICDINFENLTIVASKLGILRVQIANGATYFLELKTATTSGPYAGHFKIKIRYMGGNNYVVSGNIYLNQGALTGSNQFFLFSQSISANWQLKLDFSSSVISSPNYGGKTDLQHEIHYNKSNDTVFVTLA